MSAARKELRFAEIVAADAGDGHAAVGGETVGGGDVAAVAVDDELIDGEIEAGDGLLAWKVLVPMMVVAVAAVGGGPYGEGVFAGVAGEGCGGYVEHAEDGMGSGRDSWVVGGSEHCDTALVMYQMGYIVLGTHRSP